MRRELIRDHLLKRLQNAFAVQGVSDPTAYMQEVLEAVDGDIPSKFTAEQVEGCCIKAADSLVRGHKSKWIPAIAEISSAVRDAVSAYSTQEQIAQGGSKFGTADQHAALNEWRGWVNYLENSVSEIAHHGPDDPSVKREKQRLQAAKWICRWWELPEAERPSAKHWPEEIHQAIQTFNPHWGRARNVS